MSQTWDITYYATIVPAAGAGDTLSEGVGSAMVHSEWPFDYVSVIISVTGSGDTLSEGVGNVGNPQVWPITFWDGANNASGFGDTLSQGVGSVSVLGPAAWYSISGDALPAPPAAGSGDTLSEGVGNVSAINAIVPVTGFGDTLSEGGSVPLSTVVPPGGIRLSPYWEPGVIVYAYKLEEWLGSYEARLGAGPGPVAQIAYGDADTTVAFGGLEPGQYVAVAGRKRVHFMVTP